MPGSIPSQIKTWEHNVNLLVSSTGVDGSTDKSILLTIKNALIGFANVPCVVKGSSNGSSAGAMDGVDRWGSIASINQGGVGSNHSWIVLEFPGVNNGSGGKLQVCFEYTTLGAGNIDNWILKISPAAGFTGGSVNTAPSATDVISLQTVSIAFAYNYPGVPKPHRLHFFHSTDGAITHLVISANNTSLCHFMFAAVTPTVDAVTTGQPAGWNYPCIVSAEAASAGGTNNLTPANYTTYGLKHASIHNGLGLACGFEWEGGSSFIAAGGMAEVPNDITGQYPMLPYGIWSNTGGGNGRYGYVQDMWFISSTAFASIGSTIGADDNHRRWAVFGCLVLPWLNDSTLPLGS
jgi:hypothetical protein